MAKRGVVLGRRFAALVAEVATYGTVGAFRSPRTRQTTLLEVADEIVNQVQEIVDEPAKTIRRKDRYGSFPTDPTRRRGGLPGYGANNRRNASSNLRRRRDGIGKRTYRNSTTSRVDKNNGKLVVIVNNSHPHANKVEFGTKRFGKSSPSKRGYMSIPITNKTYKQLQKNRNLSRAERRAKGWKSAQPGAEWQRRKERDIKRRIRDSSGKKIKRGPSEQWAKTPLSKGRPRSGRRFFVGIDSKDGKPAMFTVTRKNYDGYAILRRAIRKAASKYGLN